MPYTSYAGGDSLIPESIIDNGNKGMRGNNNDNRISKNIPEPVKVIE